MTRLVTLLMLFCFVARQFDCCSVGCKEASCQELHHGAVAADNHCDCPGHHHDEAESASVSDQQDCEAPAKTPHQHHLCVASHLVYTNASRVAAPITTSITFLSIDRMGSMNQSASAIGVDDRRHGPNSAGPVRAQLGVYRI